MPYYDLPEQGEKDNILETILSHLERQEPRHVILTGGIGAGKTELLNMFIERYQHKFQGYKKIRGYDLSSHDYFLEMFLSPTNSNFLIIIDGFDEIIDNKIKQSIWGFFRNGLKFGIRVLMSSRDMSRHGNVELSIFEPHATFLKLTPYTIDSAARHLAELSQRDGIAFKQGSEVMQILGMMARTGLEMAQLYQLISKGMAAHDILSALQNKIEYESTLFLPASGLIVLQEQQKVIIQAKVIQQKLIDRIGYNMEEIMSLTPRQFEEFVGELFEKEGFKVELTQETRDNGKDLILTSDGIIGKNLYYVECKKWSPDKKVSVSIIQKLYGAVRADNATKGIVVTTSSFSDPAIREVKKIEHQMSLMDHVALYESIKRVVDPDNKKNIRY